MISSPAGVSSSYVRRWERAIASGSPWEITKVVLAPLASLRLTVALFAMTLFLVWVGTVAQQDKGMWRVIQDYFHSWVAWVEFRNVFPRSFFRATPKVYDVLAPEGGFFFPGGITLGSLLFINLISAHMVRFRVIARGSRLIGGVIAMVAAITLCLIVILGGQSANGLQGKPPVEWSTMWNMMRWALFGLWLVTTGLVFRRWSKNDFALSLPDLLSVAGCVIWGLLAIALLVSGLAIGPSSMRILWQLTQATVCGIALYIAASLLFKQRGGIVTLHLGIGLLMFGELLVSVAAVEEQMTISEGKTVSYAADIRSVELAVIDRSLPDKDRVVAVPLTHKETPTRWLRAKKVDTPELPFVIEIDQYFPNAELVDARPQDSNPATAGLGRQFLAKPAKTASGASSGEGVDMAAAYVTLKDRETGSAIGTYLLTQLAAIQDIPEKVTVDGKTYELYLRFRRNYKPFSVTLLDVRKDDYIGTNIPQNYSSDVRLVSPQLDFDAQLRISMNNPVRFAGETFYQSGYHRDPRTGEESTTLQVVTNIGWMIPYVACGIVMVGMLTHFSGVLVRFLQKTERPQYRIGSEIGWLWLAIGACAAALLVAPRVFPPREPADGMHLFSFGSLPAAYEGRVKPLDTIARSTLRFLSARETIKLPSGEKVLPMEWLAGVMANDGDADEYPIFKIDNRDVLFTLKLRPRKGNRFSIAEIEPQMDVFREQVRLAQKAAQEDSENTTVYQRKILELNSKLQRYFGIRESFRIIDEDLAAADAFIAAERITRIADLVRSLQDAQVPYAVPIRRAADEKQPRLWEPLVVASARVWIRDVLNSAGGVSPHDYASRLVAGIRQDEERVQQVVRARMLAMIRDLRSQSGTSEDDAEAVLARMPQEMRSRVEASVKESVLKELDQLTGTITRAIQTLIGEHDDPLADQVASEYAQALAAYRADDVSAFNRSVERLRTSVTKSSAKDYAPSRVAFEAYFNHISPFVSAIPLYIIGLVLAAAGMLPPARQIRWAAFGWLTLALLFHTAALAGRIYISGRPPVTNLYSSAIFIAWGGVIFGLLFEFIFRVGIGNMLASLAAPLGLLIAHILSTEVTSQAGDTMKVMQAVLDTQFWLSTHVVTVAMGYVATMAAGILGVIAIGFAIAVWFSGSHKVGLEIDDSTRWTVGEVFKTLIYATVCFAIFFSFVGTVLGGLWADDSWGRFWGWDPKENGALMIVLWNALVLHARWGRLVGNRGLVVLAVTGNLFLGWSWFGVNELGVGLHSYGFTEGVLAGLGAWWIIHLLVAMVGMLLPRTAFD